MSLFWGAVQSINYVSISSSISANRITDDWKIRSWTNVRYSKQTFAINDEKISSIDRNYYFSSTIVKSLTNHWSAGFSGTASSSTFSNTGLEVVVAPAFEYNLFPYSESTRRELRFLYRINYNAFRYVEETIFQKRSEKLFSEELSVTLKTTQLWGSATFNLKGSHFLHDFRKNRLVLFGGLQFRMFKGFSLNLYGNISRIRDQLSLRKGEASAEEVLLRRRELATSYSYYTSIGLRYTFGSIYRNIVNPRFGG